MLLKNFLAVCVFALATMVQADETPRKYVGTWSGTWYEAMTSGTLWLTLNPEGTGSIRFANLEKFGKDVTPLSSIRFLENRINFAASGDGAKDFVGHMFLIEGDKFKGSAKYDGFAVTFVLSKE
ncbi:MAG: hypothetical protein O3B03_06165 [Proteobacteria bacterium]|nr:hypothetical protein [Pseudomonadota bacterium]MDA1332450.1 hypothetical protein [Pseudomonadota bacterium]